MPKHSIANPEYRRIDRRRAVNVEHIPPQTRHPDVFTRTHCGAVGAGRCEGSRWSAATANGWGVEVVRFRENVLRLRFAPNGAFEEVPTYALPEGTTPEGPLDVTEDERRFRFATPGGELVLAKADGRFATYTADGAETQTCATPPHRVTSIMAGTVEVGVNFDIDDDFEAFHGLGDKPGHLDMHGRRYTMWNTDAFGYDHRSDELYKSIPFVLADRGDRRVGMLFDNTHRATFDFGKEENDRFRYAAHGGELTVYFFLGDDPVEICAAYCRLTGTPPMPPLWALGYQQCRWSYYPEARVREVVRDFREKRIPCDAIYLDIDYMDAYKCFTWSEVLFPNLREMVADFRAVDMRTVVMIDPGISDVEDYHVVASGDERGVWCRRFNGETMVGPVWPERCKFPDYTEPSVREWWGELYRELYATVGVSGFWNDMNEPAVFQVDRATFPDEVAHDMDGHGGTHARAHNVYGLKMTEASYDGLRRLRPDVRPFLLTRATYAGGQRYAACWTGDNTANWRHLQTANHQCIRLALSGFSLTGSDIGGFNEDPDGELYTRWIQLAIFHPVMRTHSMGNNADGSTQTDQEAVEDAMKADRRDQEPWSYGEPYTAHARAAIEWRMRLLPCLYTAMERLHRRGTPILVPAYMDDPTDAQLVDKDAFRFGEHVFVDPCLKEGQTKQRSYLPRGAWYHLQTGQRYAGAKRHTLATPLDYLPAFVRGGAVLRLDPVRQSTAEPLATPPELHVYHAEGTTESALYEDAGDGYAHERDGYLRTAFTYEGRAGSSRLSAKRTGAFRPEFSHYTLVWHGSGEGDWTLQVDGRDTPTTAEGDAYRARVPADFGEATMTRGE